MTTKFTICGLTKIREHFGDDPSEFYVQLHCEVASSETPGGEAFAAAAVSPAQLQADLESESAGIELGRGHIILLDYNEIVIRDRLQRLIDRSGVSTWAELHDYIERFFDWI